MTENRDPFAYAGQPENQDAEILALFHQWLEICHVLDANSEHEADDEEHTRWQAACDRQREIEEAIFALRGGLIGLAVKVLIDIRTDMPNWVPSVAQVRIEDDQDPLGWVRSLLRDAAAIVPEIGECAAAVIHDDAALIAADMEMQWLAEFWFHKPREKWSDLAVFKHRKALARIATTPARTPRGEAIKAKYASVTVPA